MIQNLPAHYMIAVGAGPKDFDKLGKEATAALEALPGGPELSSQYVGWITKPRTREGTFLAWLGQLQDERVQLHLEGKDDTPRYKLIEQFFKCASYVQRTFSWECNDRFHDAPEELKALTPDRVHLIRAGGILTHYARDPIIALANDGQKLLMPGCDTGFKKDFLRAIPYADHDVLKDKLFAERGYQTLPPLDLHTIQGGALVRSGTTLFAGYGVIDMNSDSIRGKTYTHDHIRSEIGKLAPKKTVHFNDSSTAEHIDMLLAPFGEKRVGFANVAKTVGLLNKHGISLTPEENDRNFHFHHVVEEGRTHLKDEGFDIVDLPAAYLDYANARLCLVSAANAIQDTKHAYIPARRYCDDARFARAGKVIDDWTFETFGKYKKAVEIRGFDFPPAWSSAGLRCTFNVIARS